MSWTTSTLDLRNLLSDGPTDRHRYRKRVFGELNGTNTTFKTFEFRRITDFTSVAAPLGVYKNGVLQSTSFIASDFPGTGEFVVSAAPVDGDVLEASYYIQWFLDSELNTFLTTATQWLGLGATVSTVADGLVPAALNYSAGQAYMKMAMRWRESLSETFRLEDAPDKKQNQTDEFVKMADSFYKQANSLRDDFYKRQGQSLSPLFGASIGRVGSTTPRT